MKSLAFPFKKDGFTHQLLLRVGRVALIRRSKRGRSVNLEVILVRTRRAETFSRAGKDFSAPEREIYPSTKLWGTYAWTFRAQDLERARAKLAQLIRACSESGGEDWLDLQL